MTYEQTKEEATKENANDREKKKSLFSLFGFGFVVETKVVFLIKTKNSN